MSRTPVREAIQRLVNEGLVEMGPDGATVAALSVKDIRSLEQANRALQSLAVESAASEASEEDMAKLDGRAHGSHGVLRRRRGHRRLDYRRSGGDPLWYG